MNQKPINIEVDRACLVVNPASPTKSSLSLYQSTEYVLQANCYSNQYSNTVSAFTPTDNWSLYIGSAVEPSASPLITINDPAKWNNVADWSASNVYSGAISVRVNTAGSALTAYLGNNASAVLTMEIWAYNDNSESTLILDNDITILNAVEA